MENKFLVLFFFYIGFAQDCEHNQRFLRANSFVHTTKLLRGQLDPISLRHFRYLC